MSLKQKNKLFVSLFLLLTVCGLGLQFLQAQSPSGGVVAESTLVLDFAKIASQNGVFGLFIGAAGLVFWIMNNFSKELTKNLDKTSESCGQLAESSKQLNKNVEILTTSSLRFSRRLGRQNKEILDAMKVVSDRIDEVEASLKIIKSTLEQGAKK